MPTYTETTDGSCCCTGPCTECLICGACQDIGSILATVTAGTDCLYDYLSISGEGGGNTYSMATDYFQDLYGLEVVIRFEAQCTGGASLICMSLALRSQGVILCPDVRAECKVQYGGCYTSDCVGIPAWSVTADPPVCSGTVFVSQTFYITSPLGTATVVLS